MQALVVYESMYGNTRKIAEAIADGLGADAVPVKDVTSERLTRCELLVLGAPTHAWGLSRDRTRKAAADAAAKPGSGLTLEPDATGAGLREWLADHARELPAAVAFDTRRKAPAFLTGRASRHLTKRLRRAEVALSVPPQSFFVTKADQLLPGELDRAGRWGRELTSRAGRP